MPTVEPLSYSALDYLKSFGVVAVAVSPSGRVFVSPDPKGAAAAWWCKREDADKVAAIAWSSGDIPSAASQLQIAVTPHSVVAKRTAERTAKIEAALQQALNEGTLKMFNREFRRRRLAAQVKGVPFMTYQTAQARLRRVVTEMVSRGGLVTQSLIASVFEDPETKTNPQSDYPRSVKCPVPSNRPPYGMTQSPREPAEKAVSFQRKRKAKLLQIAARSLPTR